MVTCKAHRYDKGLNLVDQSLEKLGWGGSFFFDGGRMEVIVQLT